MSREVSEENQLSHFDEQLNTKQSGDEAGTIDTDSTESTWSSGEDILEADDEHGDTTSDDTLERRPVDGQNNSTVGFNILRSVWPWISHCYQATNLEQRDMLMSASEQLIATFIDDLKNLLSNLCTGEWWREVNPQSIPETLPQLPRMTVDPNVTTAKNSLCPVCGLAFHANEKVRLFRCGHVFHLDCFSSIVICPICQKSGYDNDKGTGFMKRFLQDMPKH